LPRILVTAQEDTGEADDIGTLVRKLVEVVAANKYLLRCPNMDREKAVELLLLVNSAKEKALAA